MFKVAQCIDKYALHQRLGRNDHTEVWKAYDSHLQRWVVITFLRFPERFPPAWSECFQQRAQMVASLQHPNIVQIYDISVDAYVVTRYLEGPTLADYIACTSREGQFPTATEIAQLFVALCNAIDYAHQQGVLCGHIKPTQILLDQQNTLYPMGEPVLTGFDFLQSQSLSGTETTASLAHYGAPERVRGQATTPLSDLYALGVILYELYTGKLPFEFSEQDQQASPELLYLQASDAPTPPSYWNDLISPELEAVILRAIAREPEERFPDAYTLLSALVQASGISPSQVPCMEYHAPYLSSIETLIQLNQIRPSLDENELASQTPVPDEEQYLDDEDDVDSVEPETEEVIPGKSTSASRRQLIGAWREKSVRNGSRIVRLLGAHKLIFAATLPALLVASMILLPLLHGQGHSYGSISPPVSGTVSFLSSNQEDPTKNQGIDDIVSVDLTHLAAPASGKSYYAWLQGDEGRSDSPALLLGQLPITQASAHLKYVDPHHTNLLISMSRFLVTEEDAGKQPANPSPDQQTWRAVGAISHTPNPQDQENHFSLLNHLRHLLVSEPKLADLGLNGGLSTWLNLSGQRVQQVAQSAKQSFDAHDAPGLQRALIRLLDYLDGQKDVSADVPAGTAFLVDDPTARVGLLQIRSYQDPPGYLYHTGVHLLSLTMSPGVTTEQKQAATAIKTDLDSAGTLLDQVRSSARHLLTLPSDQLLQSAQQAKIDNLALEATQAYTGKGDAPHGIQWVCEQAALLATMQIKASHT